MGRNSTQFIRFGEIGATAITDNILCSPRRKWIRGYSGYFELMVIIGNDYKMRHFLHIVELFLDFLRHKVRVDFR